MYGSGGTRKSTRRYLKSLVVQNIAEVVDVRGPPMIDKQHTRYQVIINEMNNCPMTGLPVTNFTTTDHLVKYTIHVDETDYGITMCRHCVDVISQQARFGKHHLTVMSMLAANAFGDINTRTFHWDRRHLDGQPDDMVVLENEISSGIYPRTPREKLDNLLFELYQFQSYSGELVSLEEVGQKRLWRKWYFGHPEEFRFYLNALVDQNLIYLDAYGDFYASLFKITYAGLSRYIELFNEGYASNICFIAMAFVPETIPVRQAIKEALIATGYRPHIIDEQNLPSDRTINDEIIAGLRKCKFCVADFSFHRNGVYFEAGFALGQKKPVIYTCMQEEFAKAHFDIKPLQHIIYASPAELKERLISKIQAWID